MLKVPSTFILVHHHIISLHQILNCIALHSTVHNHINYARIHLITFFGDLFPLFTSCSLIAFECLTHLIYFFCRTVKGPSRYRVQIPQYLHFTWAKPRYSIWQPGGWCLDSVLRPVTDNQRTAALRTAPLLGEVQWMARPHNRHTEYCVETASESDVHTLSRIIGARNMYKNRA